MVETPCGAPVRELADLHSVIEIESPRNGENYKPNLNCFWEIKADKADIIGIQFESFNLQDSNVMRDCVPDYLEISDDDVRENCCKYDFTLLSAYVCLFFSRLNNSYLRD